MQIIFCPLHILAFKIVIWRSVRAQLCHHHEGRYGDAILSPKMRESTRIASRCHPIAQIEQCRAAARLWAVEAASARPADIFSLLLMRVPSLNENLSVEVNFRRRGLSVCLDGLRLGTSISFSLSVSEGNRTFILDWRRHL